MLNPSQTRESKILRLVAVAHDLLEAGVSSHRLFDKLLLITFRLWPGVRERTRRSYTVAAIRVVLSQPSVELNLLSETTFQQEGARAK